MKTAQFVFCQLKCQQGGRRWALSFFLGVLGAGAMAPVHAVLLLIPAMVVLLWLTFESSGVRGAFATGWWFGLGHFVAGFYWVANALLVHPDRFGWMVPFAIFALAGLMALFPAVSVVATRAFGRSSSGVGRVLVFAAMWGFFEWVADATIGTYFAKIERRTTEMRNMAARVAAILAPAPGRSK